MSRESPASHDPIGEAEAWVVRLGRDGVSRAELSAFRDWLLAPANRSGWQAVEARGSRRERYVVRQERDRFRVVDIWTGETAVIAMTPQDTLSEDDARHTARLLNRRARDGDRSIRQ
jgi:hypothetical protein